MALAEPRLPLSVRLVGGVDAEMPSEALSSSTAPATTMLDIAEESVEEVRVNALPTDVMVGEERGKGV